MVKIYLATTDDLPFLYELEQQTFAPNDQFNKQNLKHSLQSPNQRVYVISKNNERAGAAILFLHKKVWRIYSFAILPTFQKAHLGRTLLYEIIQLAQKEYIEKLILEVKKTNVPAIRFYESFGFKVTKILTDYYESGLDGFKMELVLYETSAKLKNLVITNQALDFLNNIANVNVISPDTFINEPRYQNGNYRVFNLCRNYEYQTTGYYVSLFAAARNLRVIPSIATIEDFTDPSIVESISDEISDLIKTTFKNVSGETQDIDIYFGKTKDEKFTNLAYMLYKLFPAPFLRFTFAKKKHWQIVNVDPFTLPTYDDPFITDSAQEFFASKKFMNIRFKNYNYDLAILVDDNDNAAPSNKQALNNFMKAARKIGFYTELITKEDYHRLRQFDALFIRTTTNPHDYTYQFSRLAYAEGLIVIDDPWSILRCANKVYFHESMNTHNIKTPPTMFITKATNLEAVSNYLGFPLVLKRPDSSASKGVFKVDSMQELETKVVAMFNDSAIIVAQKFLKSTYDWRVGILNNEPLFVSKYFMAKNHWQIYEWKKSGSVATGEVATYLVEAAPKKVVALARRAASVMGDGFYGVDIKEHNGEYYVIEVNDNPSIDHGAEDLALGQKLYEIIITDIYNRIELARTTKSRELLPDNY